MYSGEVGSSQSELLEAKQELASEQLARNAEAAKVQAALQEEVTNNSGDDADMLLVKLPLFFKYSDKYPRSFTNMIMTRLCLLW